ncbi:MAG: T9SS type A sorting domain-containing protein [Bacteroidia bacterium]|nr:T9SS type A sorting domain-containing protein [Bacteroidia bacterium]
MKKYFIVIILMISVLTLKSQITIDQNDMPNVNDTFRIATAANAGSDPSLTGTNYTWDYSALTPASETVDTFVSVISTPWTYQLVFNNPFGQNQATIARPQSIPSLPSLGTMQISITNEYDYFKESSTEFKKEGFGATINSVPMPITYNAPELYYKFPMQYQTTYSSISAYSLSIPNLIYFGESINKSSIVDGWGTLKLPGGDFSVLRVKSTIITNDSVYIDSLSFGMSLPPRTTTQYEWMAKLKGIPLLQVNSSNLTNTAYYRVFQQPQGIVQDKPVDFSLSVYPSPARNNFSIEYTLASLSDVNLEIFDASGRRVYSNQEINIPAGKHFLPLDKKTALPGNGLYLVKLSAGDHILVKRMLVVE